MYIVYSWKKATMDDDDDDKPLDLEVAHCQAKPKALCTKTGEQWRAVFLWLSRASLVSPQHSFHIVLKPIFCGTIWYNMYGILDATIKVCSYATTIPFTQWLTTWWWPANTWSQWLHRPRVLRPKLKAICDENPDPFATGYVNGVKPNSLSLFTDSSWHIWDAICTFGLQIRNSSTFDVVLIKLLHLVNTQAWRAGP